MLFPLLTQAYVKPYKATKQERGKISLYCDHLYSNKKLDIILVRNKLKAAANLLTLPLLELLPGLTVIVMMEGI